MDPLPRERRAKIREKYRDVALRPESKHFFHTGRMLAIRLGYAPRLIDALPDCATESFCGVGNPFELRSVETGERVVDVGSGAGLDCFIAAEHVGQHGEVVGIEMTDAMLAKSRATAEQLNLTQVTFTEGLAEELPIEDAWADVLMSNGVFNLCSDKPAVLAEARRCIRPGGFLQFADVASPSSSDALDMPDSFLSLLGWKQLMRRAGFMDVTVGPAIDTFDGAPEPKGTFKIYGHSFLARRPVNSKGRSARQLFEDS
jgi:SAM-dependent methyltransferase